MATFNKNEFKHKAIQEVGPVLRSFSFDPMVIFTILQLVAPILTNCLNKETPESAAKRIKSGDSRAQVALTKAVRQALKDRGEKSTSEQREAIRDSVQNFLKGQSDEDIVAMCNCAKNTPNFADLAL